MNNFDRCYTVDSYLKILWNYNDDGYFLSKVEAHHRLSCLRKWLGRYWFDKNKEKWMCASELNSLFFPSFYWTDTDQLSSQL
jgi:hypothetical protein